MSSSNDKSNKANKGDCNAEANMGSDLNFDSQADLNATGDDDNCITILCDENDEMDLHKRRADEMTVAAQRMKAEFDNYRKRTLEQGRISRDEGRAEVIEKLLPALDSFTQAMKIIKDKSVLEGVSLIFERLSSVLYGFGLEKVEALGQELDPTVMNAVMTRKEKGKSGMVVEVILYGYTLKGRTLRPATVIVGE